MATEIYLHYLVPDAPQIMVETPHRPLKSIAANLELYVNRLLRDPERGIEDELQAAVLDAFFSIGVMKVALDGTGQPYALHVNSSDFVVDMSPGRLRDVAFVGDRTRLSLRDMRDSGLFRPEALEHLETITATVDPDGGDRQQTAELGSGSVETLEDMVEVLDLWLPARGWHIIIPAPPLADLSDETILFAERINSPRLGPYHLLWYSAVPGNVMPLAPTDLWLDLHALGNRLFTKFADQAERNKTVGLVQSANIKDGERVKNAKDGELIPVERPDAVNEITLGGANQPALAAFVATKDVLNWQAGNLDSLGGLSPSAGTLGQERLLNAAATGRAAKMQKRTTSFAAGVCRALVELLWSDPLATYSVLRYTPNRTAGVVAHVTPDDRRASLAEFDLKIDPYSLQYRTPGERLNTLMQVWQGAILPAVQAMGAQGVVPDWRGFIRRVAKLAHLTELEDVLIFTDEPPTGTRPSELNTTPAVRPSRHDGRTTPNNLSAAQREGLPLRMVLGQQTAAEARQGGSPA